MRIAAARRGVGPGTIRRVTRVPTDATEGSRRDSLSVSNTTPEADMSTAHGHLGNLLHRSRGEGDGHHVSSDASDGQVTTNLEVDIIPVSDVDRTKQFYERVGWRLDADDSPLEGLRIVQFTPPGSGASVTFGIGITAAAPGSAEGGLVTSDVEAAHDELADRGIDVSDVWHGPPFPVEARQPGRDPERTSYGSFCSFNDPDGNTWLVQEVTTRRPGV
jgi:catechol 2,3-dioxygenase-like lactoylglutathione lyase family enzyme